MADIALPVVLFVNTRPDSCGVKQFGKRLYAPLVYSDIYEYYYIEPEIAEEFNHWANILNPVIVVYNFYTAATMGWLTPDRVREWRSRFKQCSIFHEVGISHMGFDLIFHQDPGFDGTWAIPLARPIPTYTPDVECTYIPNSVPVIGSFGFGLGGKGFTRLSALVSQQFENAHLRINIPYAHFGDIDGRGAQDWARQIRACSFNPHITLDITHDFMDESALLEWLAYNDLNAFLYDDNIGRGISGTTDYALAVKRPIAITRSDQFHHLWRIDDSFIVEQHTLPEILQRGVAHLKKFNNIWGDIALRESFENGFATLVLLH